MAVGDLDRVKLAEMDIKAGETSVVLPEANLKLLLPQSLCRFWAC